jgi:hypothetical protein
MTIVPGDHPTTVEEAVEKFLREGNAHPELEKWLRGYIVPKIGGLGLTGLSREVFEEAAPDAMTTGVRGLGGRDRIGVHHQRTGFRFILLHWASLTTNAEAHRELFKRKSEQELKRRRASECVYFIEARGAGLVKIGKATENPNIRLATLQTGSGHELKVLHWVPGWGAKEEAKLHRQFKRLHVRGEWFRLEEDLAAYIKQLRKEARDEGGV